MSYEKKKKMCGFVVVVNRPAEKNVLRIQYLYWESLEMTWFNKRS